MSRPEKVGAESRHWMPRRRYLFAALVLAVVVRAAYLWQFVRTPLAGLHRADHAFYREWARRIAEGNWFESHVFEQGPLYAYLAGAFYSLFGDGDPSLLAMQLCLGLLTVWFVYRLGQMAFDEATARVASLLTAVYGPLIFFEALVMKSFLTPLLCTFLAFALLHSLAAAGPWRKVSWIGAASFSVALLCLIRENYLLLLPVVIAVAMMGVTSWKYRIQALVLPIFVVAVCTVPASIHNYRVAGEPVWITSGGGEVLYMAWAPGNVGYYRPAPFIRPEPVFEHEDFRLQASRQLGRKVTYRESSRFWAGQAVREIMSDPLRAASLAMKKLWIAINDFEVPDSEYFDVTRERVGLLQLLPTFGWISGWGLIGLCLPGTFRRERWILVSIVGVHLLSIVLTYNFARFRLGMVPLWILFSSASIVAILRGLKSQQRRHQGWAMTGLVVGSVLSLTAFLPPPGYAESGYPQMAEGLRQFLDERQELLAKAEKLQSRSEPLTLAEREDLAKTYFAAQATDAAHRELRSIIEENPDQAYSLMLLAVVEGQRGNYAESEALLQQALVVTPMDADLWANLGNVRFHRALQGTVSPEQRMIWLHSARDAYLRGLELAPMHTTCGDGLRGVEQSLEAG